VSYTQFLEEAKAGKIKRVEVRRSARCRSLRPRVARLHDADLARADACGVSDLMKSGRPGVRKPEEEQSLLTTNLRAPELPDCCC